ncbi:sulfatase [Cognatiyoonia sp. IB215446]|uniref:sulfatase n=1 Tax=Cognatiyoonia sp. IB215446 TaxID=3097355 RepID=UPI002A0E3964|nr:sulfatase [Cognatiyoonia sp. IB215446]MDX8349417.1 sulfatase [Cognatiyoonia sp. IB215446]
MKQLWQHMPLRAIFLAALSAAILHLVLIQPNHPGAMAWDALLLIPLELPAIVLALIAIGAGSLGVIVRIAVVTSLTVIATLKFADFVMFTSLSRGFNPVADLPLVSSLYDLIVGSFGRLAAHAALVGFVIAVTALVAALWWACRFWSTLKRPTFVASLAGFLAVLATGFVIADVGQKMGRWALPYKLPATAFTARVGVERVETAQKTLADLRSFRRAAQEDPFADQSNLFDLVDRDVIVVFVESYGRTSIDTPFYADLHRETLQAAEAELEGLGLSMASTLLEAPTRGGQSWLSHATFANGLWVDNQTAYGAVLSSGRQTLYHLAAQAAFHTAAVMPQITLDWPEAQFMGFDTILAAEDLGYEGLALNWVTMPDQFTFAAMDRLLPQEADGKHLFTQIALGSSHAPWVPIPELMDWDALGDGTVFNDLVETSDPPNVVWKDRDRVRAQYRSAVDYALQVVFAYAALHAEDPPLLIVIGDHQAAGFIALDERPHVPMHVIGPQHLVNALSDKDFIAGLIPRDQAHIRSMAEMRAHLLQSLTSAQLAEAGK